MVNSLPWPAPLLATATLPPCISTSRLTSVRPMPKPLCERSIERFALHEEFENAGLELRGDAHPVSTTRNTTSSPSRAAQTEILPASSVYLAAFVSRWR